MLGPGDVFGEIGILTNMKRTCSIQNENTCLFMTLARKDINLIRTEFPQLYNRFQDNMIGYNDEDMMQRKQFVHNIPYLRGLDAITIQNIVYLMRQQVFDFGQPILLGHMEN